MNSDPYYVILKTCEINITLLNYDYISVYKIFDYSEYKKNNLRVINIQIVCYNGVSTKNITFTSVSTSCSLHHITLFAYVSDVNTMR
jgi:hypothetical protein